MSMGLWAVKPHPLMLLIPLPFPFSPPKTFILASVLSFEYPQTIRTDTVAYSNIRHTPKASLL